MKTKRLAVVTGVGAALIASTAYVSSAIAGATPPQAPTQQAGVARVAPPHLVPQAEALTGPVLAQQAPHTVPVQAFSDGCDRGYGTAAQCVPLRAPGNQPVTCGYLLSAGYLPLVAVQDHLGLVKNGRVCG